MKTKILFNIPIASLSLKQIPRVISQIIDQPGKKKIFYVNAHCLTLAQKNNTYKNILQHASLVYSGGIGPVIASKLMHTPLQERTPTPDFIFDFFAIAEKRHWSFYLLGGEKGVAEQTVQIIKKRFPKLLVVGFHDGYFSSKMNPELIKKINAKKPKIILVGMGSPKQELWIENNYLELDTQIFWSVGALFDVLTDTLPRAPLLLQKLYLEWLYRFYQEPLRLWKRYTIGNILFATNIVKEVIKSS